MKVSAVVFFAMLSLLVPSPGVAGSGYPVMTLVNMTPNGSDDAARECAAQMRRYFRAEEQDFQARGESRIRTSMVAAGDADAATSDFFEWDVAALGVLARDALQENEEWGAALLLFDCRPTDQVFRLLVIPQGAGIVRAELRGPLMSTERAVGTLRGLYYYTRGGF
jgi:hypothetical protein